MATPMTRLVEEVGYASGVDIRVEFTRELAKIDGEMMRVLNERGGHARPLYEMLAYHLGLDGTEVARGKRLRPLLGLLAYHSLTGDYDAAIGVVEEALAVCELQALRRRPSHPRAVRRSSRRGRS